MDNLLQRWNDILVFVRDNSAIHAKPNALDARFLAFVRVLRDKCSRTFITAITICLKEDIDCDEEWLCSSEQQQQHAELPVAFTLGALDHIFWRYGFQKPIKVMQAEHANAMKEHHDMKRSKGDNNNSINVLSSHLRGFLDESYGALNELVMYIAMEGITVTTECYHLKPLIETMMRWHTHLGDVTRYLLNYTDTRRSVTAITDSADSIELLDAARGHYTLAIQWLPCSGIPWNGLAVLSNHENYCSIKGDNEMTFMTGLYFIVRSMLCSQPFEMASRNMSFRLGKSLDAFIKIRSQCKKELAPLISFDNVSLNSRSSVDVSVVSEFIGRFTAFVASVCLFERFLELPHLLSVLQRDLVVMLHAKRGRSSLSALSEGDLLQMICLSIFMVHQHIDGGSDSVKLEVRFDNEDAKSQLQPALLNLALKFHFMLITSMVRSVCIPVESRPRCLPALQIALRWMCHHQNIWMDFFDDDEIKGDDNRGGLDVTSGSPVETSRNIWRPFLLLAALGNRSLLSHLLDIDIRGFQTPSERFWQMLSQEEVSQELESYNGNLCLHALIQDGVGAPRLPLPEDVELTGFSPLAGAWDDMALADRSIVVALGCSSVPQTRARLRSILAHVVRLCQLGCGLDYGPSHFYFNINNIGRQSLNIEKVICTKCHISVDNDSLQEYASDFDEKTTNDSGPYIDVSTHSNKFETCNKDGMVKSSSIESTKGPDNVGAPPSITCASKSPLFPRESLSTRLIGNAIASVEAGMPNKTSSVSSTMK